MPAVVAILAAASLSAGCGAGGFTLKKAEVDSSLYTSSVPAQSAQAPRPISDEGTVRNAVSAADLDTLGGAPIAWANAETGSRGTISDLSETKRSGLLCRRFTTTRESYDGVRLYKGEACMIAGGLWRMDAFEQVQS